MAILWPRPRIPIRALGGTMPGTQDGVPGRPVQRVSGNPPVATVPVVPPPALPRGMVRPLGIGQESAYRGGLDFANDTEIRHDRGIISRVGHEVSGRKSGQPDPPLDGPARPSFVQINRTLSPQAGTDNTRAADDLTRAYSRNSQGMYVGEQGSGWSPVYGGVPGLWVPYGSYAGVTAGDVKGIQSPVDLGAPGDGPRKVWSGPPHGLHSPTLPSYKQPLQRTLSTPQMTGGRVDRPLNSPQAGQSYSQTVAPQGQTVRSGHSAGGRMPRRPTKK